MVFVNLLAAAALLSASSQSTEWKRTDDGAARFAQAYFAKAEEDPTVLDKTKRIPTLFFYWKARWLLNFEVGPWERAQINISRIVLGMLDSDSGDELKKVLDAHPDADATFTATEEEAKAYNSRLSYFMGLDGTEEPSKLEQWETNAGIHLGDLAGKLVQYHDIHSIPSAQKSFNESLDALKKSAATAPEGANPKVVASLKTLGDTPRKTEYTLEEIKAIAANIEAALKSVIP